MFIAPKFGNNKYENNFTFHISYKIFKQNDINLLQKVEYNIII